MVSRWFTRWRYSSPQPNIMVAVVRMPSACASRCMLTHSSERHFNREIFARISSSRISAPPPGIESRPASRRRGKAVQMYLRKFLLDRTQHVFVELDAQIRMQAALHQHAGAAQLDHLFDFFVNRFQRQDVAVFRTERAVKCTERAILRAEIGVIDVAIDLVGRDAWVCLRAA